MMNIDFSACKTPTAVKNAVRKAILEKVATMFSDEFGADRVSIVFSGESTTSEISVAVADIETETGLAEICVNFKPVVKDFETRTTPSKTISAYERLVESDRFEEYQAEKKEKEKAKAKAKADKIERDKKARAERKAEKERKAEEKARENSENNG